MRFRVTVSLRILLIAVALAPVPIWGVYRWREHQLRQQALVRLDQANSGRASGGPVYSHLSFDGDSPLINLTLDGKQDPHQLLKDCRASNTRIHRLEIGDQCLVDISLAHRIASIPELNDLRFWYNAQVEPDAWPLLLSAARSISVPYAAFKQFETSDGEIPALEQLEIHNIPASDLRSTLQTAANCTPSSLVAHLLVQNINDAKPLVAEGTPLRQEIDAVQLANPQVLIRVGYAATPPAYRWQDELLQGKYEQAISNDVAWEEGLQILQQIVANEPSAWPAWQELVSDDFRKGDFGPEAEQRARKLIEIAPWTPDGYINVAMRHYQQREYQPAIKFFRRGLIRAIYGYEKSETAFLYGRTTLFLAAALVAATDRQGALRTLERAKINCGDPEDEKAILLSACWIKATAPEATTQDALDCKQLSQYVAEWVKSRNRTEQAYADQLNLVNAVLGCLSGDFVNAQSEYDALMRRMPANAQDQLRPRFLSEWKRLGDSIRQRKRFATDYVPVVPQWD